MHMVICGVGRETNSERRIGDRPKYERLGSLTFYDNLSKPHSKEEETERESFVCQTKSLDVT